MIIYTMKVIFLKCQILVFFFLFWNVKDVKVDIMVNVIMDLSIALNNYGRHGLL